MKMMLREPLLHFLLIGAAIFALYALLDDGPPPRAKAAITLTDADALRLAAEFEATWRRPPGADELTRILDAAIREEVYVREALALGLDRDDAVIRRRLQMKMEFLTESDAALLAPDDATLQAHLDAHPDRFTDPPLIAFDQVLLDPAAQDAAYTLALLRQGTDPATLGRPTMLPFATRPSPPRAIDGTFGPDVFASLGALPLGTWAGPIDSAYGSHLVRVTDRQPARIPPLAEIRDSVAQDWRGTAAAQLREARLAALLSRYDVTRPTGLAP